MVSRPYSRRNGAARAPPRPAALERRAGRARRAEHCRYGMIAWVSGIYDEPALYELACAYRDIPAEVTALQAWCGAHHPGPVGSVLELAAGPAEHARGLRRRGLRAIPLDHSPAA